MSKPINRCPNQIVDDQTTRMKVYPISLSKSDCKDCEKVPSDYASSLLFLLAYAVIKTGLNDNITKLDTLHTKQLLIRSKARSNADPLRRCFWGTIFGEKLQKTSLLMGGFKDYCSRRCYKWALLQWESNTPQLLYMWLNWRIGLLFFFNFTYLDTS